MTSGIQIPSSSPEIAQFALAPSPESCAQDAAATKHSAREVPIVPSTSTTAQPDDSTLPGLVISNSSTALNLRSVDSVLNESLPAANFGSASPNQLRDAFSPENEPSQNLGSHRSLVHSQNSHSSLSSSDSTPASSVDSSDTQPSNLPTQIPLPDLSQIKQQTLVFSLQSQTQEPTTLLPNQPLLTSPFNSPAPLRRSSSPRMLPSVSAPPQRPENGNGNTLAIPSLHPSSPSIPITNSSLPLSPLTLRVGHFSMQGLREEMEDKVILLPSPLLSSAHPASSFFAVLDGHAGVVAAEYCRQHITSNFLSCSHFPSSPLLALSESLIKTDNDFCLACKRIQLTSSSGTTAICAYVENQRLFVGNVGDSRAILVKNHQVLPLSHDHKPDRIDEKARIESMGGRVGPSEDEANSTYLYTHCLPNCLKKMVSICEGGGRPARVFPGGLSVSRTIGDLSMKCMNQSSPTINDDSHTSTSNKTIKTSFTPPTHMHRMILPPTATTSSTNHASNGLVISTPEMSIPIDLDGDCIALVLGCDGVFDVLSNKHVGNIIRKEMNKLSKKGREMSQDEELRKLMLTSTHDYMSGANDSHISVNGTSTLGVPATNSMITESNGISVNGKYESPVRSEMDQVAKAVAMAAYHHGSTDNISVVVVYFEWNETIKCKKK